MVLLQTERLLLRELTEDDAVHLFRLNLNPNVTRYVGEPALADPAAALVILRQRILPQYRDHGVGRWAVVARADGEFLGWCGLKYLADGDEYDLGYRLFEAHWGCGYATEAARAVLAWGRGRFPAARIVGKAMLENRASIHVLEKIGMRFEAEVEEHDGRVAVYVAPAGR